MRDRNLGTSAPRCQLFAAHPTRPILGRSSLPQPPFLTGWGLDRSFPTGSGQDTSACTPNAATQVSEAAPEVRLSAMR